MGLLKKFLQKLFRREPDTLHCHRCGEVSDDLMFIIDGKEYCTGCWYEKIQERTSSFGSSKMKY